LEEFLFGSGAAVGKLLAKPEDEGTDIADLVRQVSTLRLCAVLLTSDVLAGGLLLRLLWC
jgi:hypothetical protein